MSVRTAFLWNCGATGNLGDELCHLGAIEFARSRFNPRSFSRIFKLNATTAQAIGQEDVLVIGGGRLIDKSDFLERLSWYGKQIAYCFAGIEIGSSLDVYRYKDLIRPLFWQVRDKRSAAFLKEAGYENVVVAEDLSSLVEIDAQKRAATETPKIGICLKNVDKDEAYVEELSDGLDALGFPVTIVVFNSTPRHRVFVDGEFAEISDCNGSDLAFQICERMGKKPNVLSYMGGSHDPVDFASKIAGFDGMVCERLHSTILSSRFGVPLYAVKNDKNERFLSDRAMTERLIGKGPGEVVAAAKRLYEEALKPAC